MGHTLHLAASAVTGFVAATHENTTNV